MSDDQASARNEGLRIARNSAILGSGQVANLFFGFFTIVLVTDQLGTDTYGLFIGAQRFVWLFVVVAQFGLLPLTIRGIAQREDPGELVGTVLALRVALSIVFAVTVAAAASIGQYLPEYRSIVYAFVAMEVAGAFAELFAAVHEGREQMTRPTIVHLLRSAVTFAGVVAVSSTGGGVHEIVAVYLVARVVQLFGAFALLPRDLKLGFNARRVHPLLRDSLPFVAIAFADFVLRGVDVAMLARFSEIPEASRYGAALNFVEVLFVLLMLVQRSLLPALSRLHLTGLAADVAKNALVVFSALLVPLTIGIVMLSDHAMALYPRAAFDDAAPVLQILALTLGFVGMKMVCAMFLTGTGHLRYLVLATAAAVPVQVTANLLLIPRLGASGAATATVVGQAVIAIGVLVASRWHGMEFPFSSTIRHFIAAAAMVVPILATRHWFTLVPVACGGFVYFATLLLISPRHSLERRLLGEGIERLQRRG